MLIVESLRTRMGASSMQIERDSEMPVTEVARLKCTKVSESQLMGASADNKDHKYYIMNYVKFLAICQFERKLKPHSQLIYCTKRHDAFPVCDCEQAFNFDMFDHNIHFINTNA